MSAMRSFECLSFADAEEVLVEQLRAWLKDPPEYDPEGWALPLFWKVLTFLFQLQIVAGIGEIEALVAKRKIGDAFFSYGDEQILPIVKRRGL